AGVNRMTIGFAGLLLIELKVPVTRTVLRKFVHASTSNEAEVWITTGPSCVGVSAVPTLTKKDVPVFTVTVPVRSSGFGPPSWSPLPATVRLPAITFAGALSVTKPLFVDVVSVLPAARLNVPPEKSIVKAPLVLEQFTFPFAVKVAPALTVRTPVVTSVDAVTVFPAPVIVTV